MLTEGKMIKSPWAKFFLSGIFLAILGILFLSYLFYWGGNSRQESVAANNSDQPPELVLGNFYPIEGTSYFLAETFNDRPSSYLDYESARWNSLGTGGQTRNLVFLDGKTLASRKLYDTNNSFILSVVPFPEKSNNQEDSTDQKVTPVQWFVYYVVHQDSNKDDLLNENDLGVLAISDFNGLRYKDILFGALNLYELTMPEDGHLLVVYKTTEGRYVSLIDMQTQEIILTESLPELGAEVQ
jgi:hypothetical protein